MTDPADDSRLEGLDRLYRQNLAAYCATLVRIKGTDGKQQYLQFNRAQRHIDELLRLQEESTGMVRALILKARQLGICLAAKTKVLTANLEWLRIDAIQEGDELVSVDEDAPGGKGKDRKMRTCKVEAVRKFKRKAFRLVMDNGVELVATGEHRFLFKQRGGDYCQWRTVATAKAGDSIRYITTPWGETKIEDAWFGGFLDGEGSLRPKKRAGAEACVSQVAGDVLDRARNYLERRGYSFREEVDRREGGNTSKLGSKPVHKLVVGRSDEIFRLIGQSNPVRFIGRRWWEGKSLPGKKTGIGWTRVVSIEPVGTRRVVDLQTSTQTFIAEGIVSHNSTYIGARLYKKTTMNGGQRTYILTHEDPATQNLFGMAKRIHDNMDSDFRPVATTDNAYEMDFGGIDSGYRVGTAKNVAGLGRSSTIQNFHGSEVAFWTRAETHFSGVMQAIHKIPRTEIILETTANGVGGVFYEQWQLAESGESDFIAIFCPWFWAEEYRQVPDADFEPSADEQEYADLYELDPEQVCWMHFKNIGLGGDPGKIGWKFHQEFPETAVDAFQTSGQDTLIRPQDVMRARKLTLEPSENAAKVLGLDPAMGVGKDKTHFMSRQGRVMGGLVNQEMTTDDTMQITGQLIRHIDEHNFQMSFIDVTGGLGKGIYDRAVELGYGARVRAVVFSSRATNEDRYKNKRIEMWDLMNEWLKDIGGADIPDEDILHRHLCGPSFKHDSNGKKQLEGKDKIRERLGFSPDRGDSGALTFAETVVAPHTKVPGWRAEMESEARQPLNWMTR